MTKTYRKNNQLSNSNTKTQAEETSNMVRVSIKKKSFSMIKIIKNM
jgi:hypothetical protein